jgi:hypothetical protein
MMQMTMLVQEMMQAIGDGGVHNNNFSKLVIFPKLDVVMIIHFLIMELKLLVELWTWLHFHFFNVNIGIYIFLNYLFKIKT